MEGSREAESLLGPLFVAYRKTVVSWHSWSSAHWGDRAHRPQLPPVNDTVHAFSFLPQHPCTLSHAQFLIAANRVTVFGTCEVFTLNIFDPQLLEFTDHTESWLHFVTWSTLSSIF